MKVSGSFLGSVTIMRMASAVTVCLCWVKVTIITRRSTERNAIWTLGLHVNASKTLLSERAIRPHRISGDSLNRRCLTRLAMRVGHQVVAVPSGTSYHFTTSSSHPYTAVLAFDQYGKRSNNLECRSARYWKDSVPREFWSVA